MALQNSCREGALKRSESKTVAAIPRDDLLHRPVAEPANPVVKDQQLSVELALGLGLDLLGCAQLFDSKLLISILRRPPAELT
jgi:hypothetical protein